MKRYAILCSCNAECLDYRRHEVALVNDDRPRGPVAVELSLAVLKKHHPHGFGAAVKANRRGDHLDPFNYRCPCCDRGVLARSSTVVAALSALEPWIEQHGEAIEDYYECDWPATDADARLMQGQVTAELFGEAYDGEEPVFTPVHCRRMVVPFEVLLRTISNLAKDRGR